LIFLTNLPAPVVLLMQVCPEAQERPLPQSMPAGAMVGNALATQRKAKPQRSKTDVIL
jgi:hypothetical protein